MKFADLMRYYGYKKTHVARALNVCRQTVMKWQEHDAVPWDKQCEAQVITCGALLASKDDCLEHKKRGH